MLPAFSLHFVISELLDSIVIEMHLTVVISDYIIDYRGTTMTTKSTIKQPTVRVNLTAKQKLDRIQTQTDLSQPALLDRAIDLLEQELQSEQLAADFTDLANNNDALRKYNGISAVFEGAAADGLPKK